MSDEPRCDYCEFGLPVERKVTRVFGVARPSWVHVRFLGGDSAQATDSIEPAVCGRAHFHEAAFQYDLLAASEDADEE